MLLELFYILYIYFFSFTNKAFYIFLIEIKAVTENNSRTSIKLKIKTKPKTYLITFNHVYLSEER